MTNRPVDPRELAAEVGRITGRPGLADEVLSGTLGADVLAPLLAGMLDGLVRQVFGPVAGVKSWSGFDPAARPSLVGVVELFDGSKLTITVAPQ